MLNNLGVKLWTEAPNILTAWCPSIDAGPDVDGHVNISAFVCVKVKSRHFVFKNNCFKHQLNLSVKLGLHGADRCAKWFGLPYGYFSSLAKTIHWMRETGHHSVIFKNWSQTFSNSMAVRFVKNIVPKAIAERWGSCTAAENYLLKPQRDAQARSHHWNMVCCGKSCHFFVLLLLQTF